jgi:hypothetical protein
MRHPFLCLMIVLCQCKSTPVPTMPTNFLHMLTVDMCPPFPYTLTSTILPLEQCSWTSGLYLLRHHMARLPLNFHLVEEVRTILVCCQPPASSLAHTLPAMLNLVLPPKVWHFSFWDHRQHAGYLLFMLLVHFMSNLMLTFSSVTFATWNTSLNFDVTNKRFWQN